VYSLSIVWYLFLAGMGSGTYAVASGFGFAGQLTGRRNVQEYGRIAEGGFALGPVLVAIGMVFLLFDLGFPERAWFVIVRFQASILTVGVWSLLLFVLAAGLLALNKLHPQVNFPRALEMALRVIAFLLALLVMGYTGVFLASMKPVPFHHHWLLVVLFVLSSLATGAAAITLYGFLNQQRKAMNYSLRLIPRIDVALITCEALALAAFLLVMFLGSPETRYCLLLLLTGEIAPLFWAGTVVAGLVLPALVAFAEGPSPRPAALAISALLVMLGGFALRYCLVQAGLHLTQLELLI
jgi:formate-dependent nitrite reductase membrane component NrfD